MRTVFIRLTMTEGNDNLKNDFNVSSFEKDQGWKLIEFPHIEMPQVI